MNWQKASGYNTRSKVEAAISRYKRVIGDTLKSRHDTRRATGVAITIESINRMNQLGRKPPRRQDSPRKASMQQGLQARAGRGLAAFDQRLRLRQNTDGARGTECDSDQRNERLEHHQ